MQRYDSYKDSGIQWLGEIPSHWEVCKLRRISRIVRGGSPRPIEDYLSEDGYNWIKIGDTIKGVKYITTTKQKIKKSGLSATRIVHAGDLILSNSMSFGNPYILKIDGCIHDGWLGFLELQKIEKEYLYYVLISESCGMQFRLLVDGGVVQNLNIDKVKDTWIPLPSIEEQQAIASYLDTVTAKIDEAIAQQQKMIDLLNERKQIIINNAVTKGLNPNAKMKPSGIDWIGNIPEHWEVNRLKALITNMRNGYVGPTRNLYQDAGVPYIQSLHVKNGTIDFNKKEYYVSPQWANKHPKIYKDDLVIVQTGDIGNTAIITEEFNGCNCHALIIVKVNKEIVIPEYLCFYLRSKVGKELMLQTKTGALLPHLNTTEIGTTIVIVPTFEEQWDIVNYLKEEIQKVESLIKIFEKQIALLQERKQIIINDVVIGKIKIK